MADALVLEVEVGSVAAVGERRNMQLGSDAFAVAGEMAGGGEAERCAARTWP